ncbi:MAG TPA: hypothetical protein ENH15_01355 [Actinobacteria bacterium]|nr:hypothetical protein [Actinomycetota bacterium]
MKFFFWLRSNAEHYLLEAAQVDMAKKYRGGSGPLQPKSVGAFFWRRVFVPIYRLLPWSLRGTIMRAMPGSHRRSWERREPK